MLFLECMQLKRRSEHEVWIGPKAHDETCGLYSAGNPHVNPVAANCGRRPGGEPGGYPPPSPYGGPGGTGGWTFTPGNPYMPCEGGFCPNSASTSLQAILGPVTCLILLFYILLIV
ncbi:hypothetical protein SLE2022_153210 [Rubroshorea leprosula]